MATAPLRGLDRFVPRVASEWDLHAPGARWQELDASLCFVDISGFTALSERLALRGRVGVEELTDVLNRVFGTMLDLAYARGGSLLKFGGDALLLLFDGPEHPLQAAAAAVEMRTALRQATEVPMSVGRVPLRMSVGVHSGPVQLFRAGRLHQELIVAGSGASRTAEMERAASAGEIFVSPEMAQRLPRSATRPGPPGTAVLRWRRAAVAPSGPRLRLGSSAAAVDAWLPDVLRAHLQGGDSEFEHRVAAVAFVRFHGVDSLLRTRSPERVAETLHEVIGTIQVEAHEEGVTFLATDIDIDGGKVILVSGVPNAQTDDEGRLLRAARAVLDAPLPLALQVGVHRGHVFAGTIGGRARGTFTIMGDTVNLAARLMSAAPTGSLYATPGILDLSRPIFAASPVPAFHVRGKAELVHAYDVGAEIGSRAASMSHGPFVGRDKELQVVREAALATGRSEPLTVASDLGLGKSRLVHEALAGQSGSALFVAGEPDGTTSPYRAMRDALRSLLRIERSDQAAMATQLRRAVEAVEPALLPLLPLIGRVAHIEVDATAEVDAIEPRFLPDRLADAIERLLRSALGTPAVIVVEDAQWTDAASEVLLTRLARAAQAGDAGWSFVVLRRDLPGGFEPPGGRRVELGPLADGALREVLAALTTVPLRPHEVDRIVERAAGSPLVLHALVRLGRGGGGVEDLPDSLEGVLAAEIDVLPPFPRLLLRYASVLGRSFNPLVWRELLADDGLEVDDASRTALEQLLVLDDPASYRFRHAVVRDVAYRGLPYRRRQELHLRAGQVIERIAAGAVDSVADLLSLHFFEGGDHRKAWEYARLAGSEAQAAYAMTDAAALYRRALDAVRGLDDVPVVDRLATWSALGDVLEQAGRLQEALDAYRRASVLARGDPVPQARLRLKRARARERSGAFVAALREVRAGEQVLGHEQGDAASRVRVALATMRAIVRQGQEQPKQALTIAEQAAGEAERLGELAELARAYSVIDWAHVWLGELDRAVHQETIVDLYRSLGEPHRAAAALGNQGAVRYWQGRWGDALDCYRRAHAAYVQTGDVVNAAVQQSNIAEILVNRGHLGPALEAILEATRTHRAVGFSDGALFDEVQLGRIRLGEGAVREAAELLEVVVDEASELALQGTALHAAVHLAEARLAEGLVEDALAALDAAERAAGPESALFVPAVERVRAIAMARRGDLAGARRHRQAGIRAARRLGQHYELGLLLLLDGDRRSTAEGHALLEALDVEPAWAQRVNFGSSTP